VTFGDSIYGTEYNRLLTREKFKNGKMLLVVINDSICCQSYTTVLGM